MMNSKQQLLTVGEIAKMLGITRRIILNYESHGLIQADTRGEFASGYRYYTMDTLVRIRTIRSLQNCGLSLQEIKNYLADSTDLMPMLQRLEALRDELNRNIALLQERMEQGVKSSIHIAQLPPHTVYCKTMRDESIEARTTHLREVAYAAVNSYGTDISKRMYFTESSFSDPGLVTYCAAVPDSSTGAEVVRLPQTKALVKYHYGRYELLPLVRNQLLAYAETHDIKLSGSFRHIYLEGPPQHRDPERFITIVAFLIDEKE